MEAIVNDQGSIELRGSARIDWMYPNIYNAVQQQKNIEFAKAMRVKKEPEIKPQDHIEICLFHVRSSNNIRIHYDSDRDGYVIESPVTIYWPKDAKTLDCAEDLIETAFIPAWPHGISNEFPDQIDGPICLVEFESFEERLANAITKAAIERHE